MFQVLSQLVKSSLGGGASESLRWTRPLKVYPEHHMDSFSLFSARMAKEV